MRDEKIFPVGAIYESPDNLWQVADVAMQDLTLMGIRVRHRREVYRD